jgi:hypothetical protein
MKKRNMLIAIGVLVIVLVGYAVYSQNQLTVPKKDTIEVSVTPVSENPSQAPGEISQTKATVNIYMVALEDNGKSGPKIGCNDSLVAVKREVSSPEVLRGALTELLAYKQQYFGESGLYNALYQSNLQIHEIEIENGVATVKLTGQVQLGGTCDSPRFAEQLKATVLQFPTVTKAEIFINDRPLSEITSQK